MKHFFFGIFVLFWIISVTLNYFADKCEEKNNVHRCEWHIIFSPVNP